MTSIPFDSALFGTSDKTPRGVVARPLAHGFAPASQPLASQAIHTDGASLIAGEVRIDVADGQIAGYRAAPRDGGGHPVLLVVQEVFGVHEHIRDLCRRYARLGFHAIAPELFTRQGDVSKMTDVQEILSTIVSKVPDAQVMADLDATLAFAAASGADGTRVGIVGYCWGGRMVWLYAHHNPLIKAGVAYYGKLSGMASAIKPRDPVDIGDSLTVPVLGLYATQDASIALDTVEQMRSALAKGRSGSQVVVFPGVGHAFNADYRPSYDAATATYAAGLARDWLGDRVV